MPLRGVKATAKEKRLKLFMYSFAGIGKTTAAIQMPRPYIIDTERGTEQDGYVKLIEKAKGVVFRTTSIEDVLEELRALLTEKHEYKTIVIDPVTNLEDNIIQAACKKYGADEKEGGDMRVWRDRDRYMRRMFALLLAMDMNVVLTAHAKIEYGENFTKLGQIYEGWKKFPYAFDLVLQLDRVGSKRMAKVVKSRISGFPDESVFEWSYDELTKRYPMEIMEKAAQAVKLATPEQIAELKKLMDTVKLPDGWEEKCFQKAAIESWEDMPHDLMEKCIAQLRKKLSGNGE